VEKAEHTRVVPLVAVVVVRQAEKQPVLKPEPEKKDQSLMLAAAAE
jgi:hypothetical protein